MNIIGSRKIWFTFSGIIFSISVIVLVMWGLKFGVDFTGGSVLELQFKKAPEQAAVLTVVKEFSADTQVQTIGDGGFSIKTTLLTEEQHQKVLSALKEKFGEVEEKAFDSIGPSVGQELKNKSVIAVMVVTIMILLYVAWTFRHVSKPVPSIVYGGIVVLTFVHDVGVPLGLFAILGHFYNVEIGSSFIAAVLTILGYSINDTIIVLDRVRENLRRVKGTFEQIVEASVHQTISRSINTSLTVILALLAVYFFGGESIKDFALALIVGVAFGTYSSIFIASPMLVVWQKWKQKS